MSNTIHACAFFCGKLCAAKKHIQQTNLCLSFILHTKCLQYTTDDSMPFMVGTHN